MSSQARLRLVNAVVLRDPSAALDLLNASTRTGTQTELIALLLDAVTAARTLSKYVLITSVRSDHHDDSALGPHSHARGLCADVWLLRSKTDGDYEPGTSATFSDWLAAVRRSPWFYECGLAGECNTPYNLALLAPYGFVDIGADHVHLSAGDPRIAALAEPPMPIAAVPAKAAKPTKPKPKTPVKGATHA